MARPRTPRSAARSKSGAHVPENARGTRANSGCTSRSKRGRTGTLVHRTLTFGVGDCPRLPQYSSSSVQTRKKPGSPDSPSFPRNDSDRCTRVAAADLHRKPESWPRFLPGCPRGDPRIDVDYTSSARGKRATRPRYGVVRAAMRRNDLNSVHPRRCFRHLRCDQVPESCATFVLAAVESRFARAARRQQCGVSPSLVDQKRLASQTSRAAPPLSRDERRPLFHQVANRIGPVAGPCGPGNDEKASPRRSSGDGET